MENRKNHTVEAIWYYVFNDGKQEYMWFQTIYSDSKANDILKELKEKNDEYGTVVSFGELTQNENGKWYCKTAHDDVDREIDDNLIYIAFEKREAEEKKKDEWTSQIDDVLNNVVRSREYGD